MVTSWYDTQQCRSGLHKSGKKAQQQEGRIIWTAARPPDREAEGPMWTAAATRPAVVVQRKPPVPRVRTRPAARPSAAVRPDPRSWCGENRRCPSARGPHRAARRRLSTG